MNPSLTRTEHVQNKENINKRTSLFVLIITDYIKKKKKPREN